MNVLNMCDTCVNDARYQTVCDEDCSVKEHTGYSPNRRFADELIPIRLLERLENQNCVIACDRYVQQEEWV